MKLMLIIKHLEMDKVKTQSRMLDPLGTDFSALRLLNKMNSSNSKWLRPLKRNKFKPRLTNGVLKLIQVKQIQSTNLKSVRLSLLEPSLCKKKALEAQHIIKPRTSSCLRVQNITQSKLQWSWIQTLKRKKKKKRIRQSKLNLLKRIMN